MWYRNSSGKNGELLGAFAAGCGGDQCCSRAAHEKFSRQIVEYGNGDAEGFDHETQLDRDIDASRDRCGADRCCSRAAADNFSRQIEDGRGFVEGYDFETHLDADIDEVTRDRSLTSLVLSGGYNRHPSENLEVFEVRLVRSGQQSRHLGITVSPDDSTVGLTIDSVTDGPSLIQIWNKNGPDGNAPPRPVKPRDFITCVEANGRLVYDPQEMISALRIFQKDKEVALWVKPGSPRSLADAQSPTDIIARFSSKFSGKNSGVSSTSSAGRPSAVVDRS